MLFDLVMYALLGAIAGVLAGMLGVGGGIIIVPLLVIAFSYQSLPVDIIMHLALGTSLASIVFTSISSARAHHKHEAVDWSIVKKITLGIIIGTYAGTFFASKIQGQFLQIFFSVFLLYVAWQMLLGKPPRASRSMPNLLGVNFAGLGIGVISSLVGIGGGTISVPYMVWHNIAMRRAIATSAAIGIPIAVAGCVGYIFNGLNVVGLPQYSLGYVFLSALGGIVICSVLTAPIGARLAHTWPVSTIKKCFAVLLFAVSFKMFFDAF